MSERHELRFGDLGQVFDGPHATPQRVDSGPYFLNISSLLNGRLDLERSDHISEEEFVRWTRRVTPAAGDLLFSYETRLGEAALMPPNVKACLGRRMALLRPNRKIVDPNFLLYFYLSPIFQALIEKHTIHGATVNRIGLSTMGRWPVSIPTLAAQRPIAKVLGALDDKIAANSKLMVSLHALARTAYQAASQSSKQDVALGDLMSLEYGKSLPAGSRNPGKVAVYGSGGVVGQHNSALVDREGVVVGRKGTAGAVHWAAGPHFPIDTTYFVVPTAANVSSLFCYFLLKSLKLETQNSDSAVPGLNRTEALANRVRLPDSEQLKLFADRATPAMELVRRLELENTNLGSLRDTLLPELMSGKLRVRDAEKSLEEVL